MKNIFLFLIKMSFIFQSFICFSQDATKLSYNFNKENCYIIARGTKSKQAFISKQFNIINDSITHIGIGFYNKNNFTVYNVNAVRNLNALTTEDYASFINQPDLNYIGIWKIEVDPKQLINLKKYIKRISENEIEFDFDFIVGNGSKKLYCSEFCWLATNELGADFKFELKKIKTSNLGLEKILKREILEYIPPDYFLSFSNLKFIGSWWLNNNQ